MPDILHFVRIQAPAQRVYQALTTADEVRNWWTRDADLDMEVGGVGEFRFSNCGSGYATNIAVEELQPPGHVGWKIVASFRPEWRGTTISFDLREDGSGAILIFAQRGFAQLDERFAQTNTGWAYYLVSLKHFLETGQGSPSPDIDFARMLR